jgi:hypothetical protein
MRRIGVIVALAALAAPALAQDAPQLTIGGTTYTKFLWSTQRDQGSLFNFTTVPGEGWGNNGQGSEIELFVNGRLSRQVEFRSRIHSRFSQNQWTNFGGFGGSYDPARGPDQCVGGSCGEFDPRSNQYVKLRGVSVILTPGYRWLDSAVVGASDLGQFDSFVIGQIRYIDRDNASGVFVRGSGMSRQLSWEAARISLPRLWAGPGFSTGDWHASDAAYALQAKFTPSQMLSVAVIGDYVNDREIDPNDFDVDNGYKLKPRFRNAVGGLKIGARAGLADVRAAVYYSYSKTEDPFVSPSVGFVGFSPVLAGKHEDWTAIVNVGIPNLVPGFTLNLQGFRIGAEYSSIMASRREADVLLTEGHDATFAFPGPSNAKFGVFGGHGNDTVIGYGGWSGNAQQVPTINVDNEFSDFDEPMAETTIGWVGGTANPVFSAGPLELSGEYTFITYDTNWQAWDDPSKAIGNTEFPSFESPVGVGSFRSAYAPFQDKQTHIVALRAKYVLDVLSGIELFGKVKYIYETDKRINEDRFLPYNADNSVRTYNGTNSTADIFGDPSNLASPQWRPFRSLSDDDRELNYVSFNVGAGYQLTDDLYVSLTYAKYLADLKDGNTAFQAYNLHEMASGDHDKNQLILRAKYILAGAEFGLEGQYNFGTFKPDFGDGFVVQSATAQQAQDSGVPVGSPGFAGRFGGWNSLLDREFEELRMKAFMKVQF